VGDDLFKSWCDRDYPIGVGFDGFFAKPLEIFGMMGLLDADTDR
jgi:hypothetical protein